MAVKEDQRYQHFRNKKYYDFICVSLPVQDKPSARYLHIQQVYHTEDKKWINLYVDKNVAFTDYEEYLAIYQAEDDLDAEHLYARPLDMFLGMTEDGQKRFTEVPSK
ncbi:hypothetical protein ACQKJG_18180 [Priestia megaterium]|uniref:hypothetical protein n=1 Tax=Priestia megaterium TaxID=1404 RepID=UPI003D08C211